MRLQLLIVFCICLMQVCFGSVNHESTNDTRKSIRDAIGGVSEKFIDDVLIIYDKFEGYRLITESLTNALFRRLKNISEHENISKIDANSIKIYNTAEFSAKDNASYFDSMKAFQSILLKRLPTETTNRMTNLYYAVTYPNATTEEMEDAVSYLYSNETVLTKDPLRNIQEPNASECPKIMQRYTNVQDTLISMKDIKPSVLQDLAVIIEKFSCNNNYVIGFLEDFVEIIKTLQEMAKNHKGLISTCMIILPLQRDGVAYNSKYGVKTVELFLFTRLMDEQFRGMIDFENALIFETPTDEIQKALKYVFIDAALAETNCSSAEHESEAK